MLVKIGLFPNLSCKKSIGIIKELFDLKDRDIKFILNYDLKLQLADLGYVFGDILKTDVIIALGGDGTLIKAARMSAPYNIPVLGVNFGHLGFLTELNRKDLKTALEKLKNREYYIEERMMLNAKIINGKQILQEYDALNDVVISRKSSSRMICVKVKVNNYLLDNYYADGVIIASPTGSTGYSLSAGGPVLDPSMSMIIITPICPHSLHSRSTALSDDKEVILEPDLSYNNNIAVTIDGQVNVDIKEKMKVVVNKSDKTVKLIRFDHYNFYELLRTKLYERTANSF